MNVVAFAGGVGGAKLADGLAQALPPQSLSVIVNTGDDFEHLGLKICPDLDTVCYTLAGLANSTTGWGRTDETWHALESLEELGGPTWFRLGDRDLGVHLERTRRLQAGESLSAVTRDFCRRWGIETAVFPMSDEAIPTWVETEDGDLPFQEYFVHQQCQPKVLGFRFEGALAAAPAPGVLPAIAAADLVIFCPSNPWVSIDPVLAVPGLRQALAANGETRKPVVAVSPIIGNQTVKGPAAKMYLEMGIEPSALSVARHYQGLLSGFVMDAQDAQLATQVEDLQIHTLVTETIMKSPSDRRQLAEQVLALGAKLL